MAYWLAGICPKIRHKYEGRKARVLRPGIAPNGGFYIKVIKMKKTNLIQITIKGKFTIEHIEQLKQKLLEATTSSVIGDADIEIQMNKN